ncbi:Z band alternatively spliced PDZ-motif protein 52 [Glossina fuscipes fuscipes]
MSQPQLLQIKLSRFDAQPWGFRLQGGVDFASPLLVQKVNGGSLAEQAGLMPGDSVVKINDVDVFNLRHKEAQDVVVRSGNNFVMTVQRGGSTWRPQITPTGQLPQPNSPYLQTVTKTSLAHKQLESQHVGCGYNNAAKPFTQGVDGSVKSIVNKQYNSPVGIYSDESIAETLSAQAEVLAGGVLGVNFKKNEKEYHAEKSEVLKLLREEESGKSTPAFNIHPHQEPQQQYQQQHQQQQHQQQQQHYQPSFTRHVSPPVSSPKPPSTGGLPTGQNICSDCERLITLLLMSFKGFLQMKDTPMCLKVKYETLTCVETAASSTSNFYWTHSHAIGGNERRYTSVSQKQHDERTGTKLQHQTLAPAATHRPNLSATMATQTGNKFEPIDEHQSGGSEAAITTDNDFATASASQPDPRLIVMPVCPALQTPEYKAELEAAAAAAAQDGSPRPLSAGGHPACQMCGVGIVGVFVRIKDKNLHVECFKCATCGTSLKNQGYYNFNNKLYCDIHAKLAALQNPPAGTEGYVPVPIKPNTKLSASTISSALSAHGYNGVANGNSGTPTPSSHEDNSIVDLPLPPPPSPTQLQQYENQTYPNTVNITTEQQQQQQQQLHNQHTRTYSSLSSLSTGSNITNSSQSLSPLPYNCNQQQHNETTASTLSLDRFGSSPIHSRQTSSSSSSLGHGGGGTISGCSGNGGGGGLADGSNYISMPPVPPPPPLTVESDNALCMNSLKQRHNNSNAQLLQKQNENELNVYNKSNDGQQQQQQQQQQHLQSQRQQQQEQPFTQKVVAPNASTSIIVSSSQVDKVRDSVNSNCNSNCTTVTNATNEMFPTMATMPSNITSADNGDKPFEYVTLTGNVIRSVVPPGKGSNVNYKVSQGYVRPFGAIPATTTPRSSVIYPPQPQQWSASAPPPTQSKPISNPYATLPRSNVGQQGRKVQSMYHNSNYSSNYATTQYKKTPNFGANRFTVMPVSYNKEFNYKNNYYNKEEPSEQSLHPQHAETYFEDDYEVEQANKQSRGPLVWPPPEDENRRTPTATPLYIAPPGTQHIAVKPLEEKPVEKLELSITTGKHLSSCSENQESTKCHWQSRSAPQLTNAVQHTECESGSDSYTSTSTTTTTTSEEYQRMYAAQVHAYQMQQLYEQSGSDFDYHMDMEVAAMQQRQQEHHEHFNLTSAEYLSGRRSTQECAETLAPSLNTFKLVDMVREVTPSPVPQSNNQASRHVAFVDKPEVKEVDLIPEQLSEGKEDNESNSDEQLPELQKDNDTEETVNEQDCLIKEDRSQILESQRIFQPTPEIKIDIAPVRQIPPTKIPNPVPKQWINPMVAVLTTAPEVPFHMMDCLPPPTPCDECCCQAGSDPEVVKEIPDRPPNDNAPELFERPPSAEPEETVIFRENPPQGSWLTKAITTAPEFPLKFVPPSSQGIPLPEETEAYMPPPIDMKPYLREDYRPKSPFVSALTVAPERPFEGHFDRDVPIHLLDLPTPKERLTLTDALATAPERPYTPLNPENATHMFEEKQKEQEKKKLQFQILDREEELGLRKETAMEFYTTERKQSKAFAAMQAFQCSREPLSSADPPKHSLSYAKDETNLEFQKYCSAHERYHKRRDYFTKKEQELQEQLKQQQQQQQQTNIRTTQQTNKRDESTLYSSAKQSSSTNSSSAVQQMSIRSHASSNLTQEQKSSYSSTYESATAKTVSSKIDTQEIIQETAEDLEHSEVIFPPPSPLSHMKQKATLSGLHRPETLPKYQRNWTVLPTQSPVRTPEPSELRENVPLAFVDTPKTPRVADGVESNAVHKPVAKLCAQTSASSTVAQSSITSASTVSNYQQRVSEQRQQQFATLANSNACTQHTVPTTVPIIIEDRSGPVTMAFQSIDEHMIRDESQTPSRPYTPSSFTNKPAPIIPPYQTPEKLCFDECAPTHGKLYDRCSVSPLPDRARSPAPGPPPNPLAAIRAPRLKDDEMASVSQRMLQAGSITTGQSYLGAQQAKQQGQLLAHTETSSQSAMQSYMEKPEKHDQLKVGNVVVQKTEKESRLEEQKQSQLESHTKTQMGNVQIERRRKVTEEFEHTSSAKTTEIRTGSQNASSERRQSYGKTGYVANQAKRLSGLEEEISNLSSQSQAISARAANLTETKFPEVHGEGGAALFPSKPMVPSYSESKTASYVVSGAPDIKMVSSFAGKTMQPQEHLSNVHEASVVSAKQQQQKSLSAYSSNISSSVASCSQQQQQRQANAVSCSLTKASATNQAYATSIATNQYTSTTSQNVCPTMGALCGSRDTCCKSQQPVQTPSVNNYNNNYRPNASAGLTDFEPPQTRATSFAAPQSVMQTPLTAPAPTTTAVPTSTNYNIGSNVADGSSGGMASKGGAYGATSAPKRGRGIINKAVGPGVRVPLCNSCNTQIRGPFITALGRIWCPEHFICVNANCRRALQDIGFVEEKGDLYCEYCFEKYLAPTCSKCGNKIKGDCLNAIGKHFHPECFNCAHCGKLFGNTPFFLEDGNPYCEADWNELFTTKCFACGFPVEAGDRWVEALNHNYHSQCFNCTYCKQNLEGQSFYNKGGRPFCKNHAR